MLPALPGFVMTCIDVTTDNSAVRIFQISYFVCCPLALIIYLSLNYIWPVQGLGVQEFIRPEDNPRTQAIILGQEIVDDEKQSSIYNGNKDSVAPEEVSV